MEKLYVIKESRFFISDITHLVTEKVIKSARFDIERSTFLSRRKMFYTLCGTNILSEDVHGGYEYAYEYEFTDKKVNCKRCCSALLKELYKNSLRGNHSE